MNRAPFFIVYAARQFAPAVVSALQFTACLAAVLTFAAACLRWPWLVVVLLALAAIGYVAFRLLDAWESFQFDFNYTLWWELQCGEWYQ